MDLYKYVIETAYLISTSENFKLHKTLVQKIIYLSLSPCDRNRLYRPYLYGPYSDKVQSILEHLIIHDFISFNFIERSYFLTKKYPKVNKKSESSKSINRIIAYLNEKGFYSVKEVSNLSKVFMLTVNNSGIDKTAWVSLIRTKCTLLKWEELCSKEEHEIRDLIALSKELSSNVSH